MVSCEILYLEFFPCPLMCRESIKINSSLMTLGRCIEALRWNQQHKIDGLTSRSQAKVIPYRESKITQLFRSVIPELQCLNILNCLLFSLA